MTQPLVKLGLLVCLPILLHTFVPMQAWWPALRYSSSYKQDAHFATLMLALTALILAFAMKFGLRRSFPLGEATDIGMSDRDA
ncbi:MULTISPECIES: hypothetical protein [unclassified Pseudovibrio]|uniref:hypothetical protein n=1 Tax=unclassified Pseudovibrio TaxID=2627060 RepID=UPI0007AE3E1B|nr:MULTISPECIES: hypothetical protein [unclassified Pseudovibrio]KZL02557.1 hypothetical protein PsW74_01660 [Pseudovibrio sp. W74]KZL07900.1 hypothetical protein PsAD14_03042 [Pseudovibrio sp. Ad14]